GVPGPVRVNSSLISALSTVHPLSCPHHNEPIVIPLVLRANPKFQPKGGHMIGVIGVGDMGLPMSGHMVARGFDVVAYDVDPDRLAAAAARGATPASDSPKWRRWLTFSSHACAPTIRW